MRCWWPGARPRRICSRRTSAPPRSFSSSAICCSSESRYREAVDAYERARGRRRARTPSSPFGPATGLVRVASPQRRFLAARAAKPAPSQPRTPNPPMRCRFMATRCGRRDSFRRPTERYRDALSVDPKHARAHHGLARVHTVSRDFAPRSTRSVRPSQAARSEPEFHHTDGYIQERSGHFAESAGAAAPTSRTCCRRGIARSDRSSTRAQVRFLESFEGRTPFAVDETDGPAASTRCRSASCATRSSSKAASTAAGRPSSCSTPARR